MERIQDQENGPNGLLFGISPALIDVFLPLRLHHLDTFLHSSVDSLNQNTCIPSEETGVLTAEDEATPMRPLPQNQDKIKPPLSQEEIM